MWRIAIFAALAVNACTEFPGVDDALTEGDPLDEAPPLLPFEELLAADDPRVEEDDDEALIARADALRDRADGLRDPVIDDATRARMEDGVQEP